MEFNVWQKKMKPERVGIIHELSLLIGELNKGATENWIEFSTWGLKNPATYKNLIHKHQMKLSGSRFTLYIPPRTA